MTERQKEFLRCYLQGASQAEVSIKLNIRQDTVREHMKRIRAELNVNHSRLEIMDRCRELGLITLVINF